MCGALYRAVLRRLAIKKAVGNRNEKFREVKEMREGIHPAYYQAKVVCNCGNEFVTGSTKKDIHVEVCSKCHSFYTGQQQPLPADVSISSTASTASTQANKFEPCKGWVLVATLNSAFLFSSFFILKGQHEVFRNWRSGGN